MKGVEEDGLRKGTSTLAEHKAAEESRKSVPWYALVANITKQYTATGSPSGSDYYFWELDLETFKVVDFSLFFCYDEKQPLQAPPQTLIYLTSHTPSNTLLS